MSVWVTRINVDGDEAVAPMRCVAPESMLAQPGHRTYAECLALLVAHDEECSGEGGSRPIRKRGQLVGYLILTDRAPYPPRALS
jgi:hypothetical protein